MSNLSKRKRTDFTGGQRLNRQRRRMDLWGKMISRTLNKKLTEVFSSGFTASTGAEDMKRQEELILQPNPSKGGQKTAVEQGTKPTNKVIKLNG